MRNIDINKIIPRLLDLYHKLDKKGFLFALLVTFFIFIPLELTFVSIFTKKDNEILSYFNIDNVIVLSSIFSLIVNNWLKGGGTEREKLIKLTCEAVFLLALALFFIFSIVFSICFYFHGNTVLVIVHLLIFLVVFYFILALDWVMNKFNKYPYRLYITLWSILLFSYILYGLIFKVLK